MDEKLEQPDRLRPHPTSRFAGPSHQFDLNSALSALRAEAHPGRDGHRQVTIFHRPPVSHVLFSFDAGGHLPAHTAHGVVTIHVLQGRFTVLANDTDHTLNAGQLLVLKPDVLHDVKAQEAGAMLLTVVMEYDQ